MTKEFKTVALVGLYTDSRVAEPMQRLAAHLTKAGIAVVTAPDIAAELATTPLESKELVAAQVGLYDETGRMNWLLPPT